MAGRPRNVKFTIVDPGDIMAVQVIRNETWCMRTICEAVHDSTSAMSWLAKRRLLKNQMECTTCNVSCSLQVYNQGVDGKRWACPDCGFRKSIRIGSFFTRSHLPLHQIILLMYCFALDYPQNLTQHETGIQHASTIMDWFSFCRKEICVHMGNNADEIGGMDVMGEPIIVEIDESKYFHRKYHRGQWREGHWVFGGVERSSGKCFLVEVGDRTAATLEAVIRKKILPGSHIMSDGWAAYRNLEQLANGIYMHSVVVHERNFVNPLDPNIHTQTIENLWMRAKRKLKRQFGTSRANFPSYLREFEFRCSVHDGNFFGAFLVLISENYVY